MDYPKTWKTIMSGILTKNTLFKIEVAGPYGAHEASRMLEKLKQDVNLLVKDEQDADNAALLEKSPIENAIDKAAANAVPEMVRQREALGKEIAKDEEKEEREKIAQDEELG